jgi:chorismate mutase
MRTIEELTSEIKAYSDRIAAAEAKRAELLNSIAPLEDALSKSLAAGGAADTEAIDAAKKAYYLANLELSGLMDARAVLERELAEAKDKRQADITAQIQLEVAQRRAKMLKRAEAARDGLADDYAFLAGGGDNRNDIRLQKLQAAIKALEDLLDRFAMFENRQVAHVNLDELIAEKKKEIIKRFEQG